MLSEQSQMWQKVSMALGWSSYDVGLPYYGGWDKPVEPTPAEIKKQEFDKLKKDTKTADQIVMILDLGLDKIDIKVPIVIRLAGTNVDKGNKILKDSKIKYIEANTLEDAANKAVKALKK